MKFCHLVRFTRWFYEVYRISHARLQCKINERGQHKDMTLQLQFWSKLSFRTLYDFD